MGSSETSQHTTHAWSVRPKPWGRTVPRCLAYSPDACSGALPAWTDHTGAALSGLIQKALSKTPCSSENC